MAQGIAPVYEPEPVAKPEVKLDVTDMRAFLTSCVCDLCSFLFYSFVLVILPQTRRIVVLWFLSVWHVLFFSVRRSA